MKPDFDIKSNADLLTLLRRYSPRGGMPVKKIRESYPNANAAIEELEKEGKIIVMRTGGSSEREGQIRTVFWNEMEMPPKIDEGGPGLAEGRSSPEKQHTNVSSLEFHTMWHSLRLPDAITISRELEEGKTILLLTYSLQSGQLTFGYQVG